MFTSIEFIAFIVSVLLIIKVIFAFLAPRSWLIFAKNIYSMPKLVSLIALILAAIVLNYLLKEVSITQIFAVMAFIALLILVGVSSFALDLIKVRESLIGKNFVKNNWWYLVIWLLLAVWVLEEILT